MVKLLIPLIALALPLPAQEIIQPAKKTATQIKAEKITIPSIHFEDTSVEDAIQLFRNRGAEVEYLTKEDRLRNQINFVLRGKFPKRIDKLHVRNVTIHEALRQISLKTGAKIEYDDYAVIIIGKE